VGAEDTPGVVQVPGGKRTKGVGGPGMSSSSAARGWQDGVGPGLLGQ